MLVGLMLLVKSCFPNDPNRDIHIIAGITLVLAGCGFVAAGPTAAVDDHHAGVLAGVVRGQVEVGFFGAVGREVSDVLFDADFGRIGGE